MHLEDEPVLMQKHQKRAAFVAAVETAVATVVAAEFDVAVVEFVVAVAEFDAVVVVTVPVAELEKQLVEQQQYQLMLGECWQRLYYYSRSRREPHLLYTNCFGKEFDWEVADSKRLNQLVPLCLWRDAVDR